ncbi:MAG: FkbM family methyltransferase [Verrucomicrobiae bacterium]|nr:FkbM family methyltransferase [Verrucomicrobiae bacterium]
MNAAQKGHEVIAFDISPKAINLLRKGARANQVNIQTVEGAFSVEPYFYTTPTSSHTENQAIKTSGSGQRKSITFLEAAERFGIPQVIKMDIEGNEKEFLQSSTYRDWLTQHNILWIFEMHKSEDFELLKNWKTHEVDPMHFAVNFNFH